MEDKTTQNTKLSVDNKQIMIIIMSIIISIGKNRKVSNRF